MIQREMFLVEITSLILAKYNSSKEKKVKAKFVTSMKTD